jgi:DegV family protein with EDD domain
MKEFLYEIVTDSCANLPDAIIDGRGLPVVTLRYNLDGEEYPAYVKGRRTEIAAVYGKMRAKSIVKTAAANEDDCEAVFAPILAAGKDLLYIGFSSALSLTFKTACRVLDDLRAKYPERKITAIDSLCAALGQGLLVTRALDLRDAGSSIDETARLIEGERRRLVHLFTVDSLSYLYRGGRLSKTGFIIASTLNIKPVLHVDDEGRLAAVNKVFGRRAALSALVKKTEAMITDPEKQTVYIGHGDCEDEARYIADKIRERLPVKDILLNDIDLVIGAHSGPGTIAVFFFGEKR